MMENFSLVLAISKHVLWVREVLDEIKTKFYELEGNTASWEDDDRARIWPVISYRVRISLIHPHDHLTIERRASHLWPPRIRHLCRSFSRTRSVRSNP